MPHTAQPAAPAGFHVDLRTGTVSQRQAAEPAALAVTPKRAARRHGAVPSVLLRGYDAAKVSDLTASFTGEHGPLNDDLQRSLALIRARSRQLYKNNDYVKKFMRMAQNHIVGPEGVTLSVPCRRPDGSMDEADRAVVENAFKRFSRRGVFDVTGRLSRTQAERLLVLMWARDGEFFVRRVRDRKLNAFGYALQIIDPVLVDETYHVDLTDGRRVRLGVEIDVWGRPLAYHLRPDIEHQYGGKRVRVPASEMWHHFLQEEPDQVRGVPWVHTAMITLQNIGGYVEAAIIAARVGASNMGFFIPPAGDTRGDAALATGSTPTGTDADQDGTDDHDPVLTRDATPGAFDKLPPGYDFKKFDPDYPHANFEGFMKAMLRGVSSGMGASYNTLANDLEGVNFSSIRQGKLEDQDEWMCLQRSFRESFHDHLGSEWLEMAFLSGELGALPIAKFAKYDCFEWQFRRWPWVDPFKDAQTRELEIRNTLNSYSGVMRELGRDPDKVWAELERDLDRVEKLRRRMQPATPTAPASPAGAVASGAPKPNQDDDDDEDK